MTTYTIPCRDRSLASVEVPYFMPSFLLYSCYLVIEKKWLMTQADTKEIFKEYFIKKLKFIK